MLPKVKFTLDCQVSLNTQLYPDEHVFGQKLVNPIDIVIGAGGQGEIHAWFVAKMQQVFRVAQGAMEYI